MTDGLRGFPLFSLIIVAAGLAGGCAQPARVSNMQATSTYWHSSFDQAFLHHKISSVKVSGGQPTLPFWKSKVGDSELKQALQNSLQSGGLLAPVGHQARYLLEAYMVDLQQQAFGIDLEANVVVRYALIDTQDGTDEYPTVWEETITQPATATMGDSLYGPERLRVASEVAIRENIKKMMTRLYEWEPASGDVEDPQ